MKKRKDLSKTGGYTQVRQNMKIKTFGTVKDDYNEAKAAFNLELFKVEIRSDIVILVGKNGAGKSRIFKYITQEYLQSIPIYNPQNKSKYLDKEGFFSKQSYENFIYSNFNEFISTNDQDTSNLLKQFAALDYESPPNPLISSLPEDYEIYEEYVLKKNSIMDSLNSYFCLIDSKTISDLRIGLNAFHKNKISDYEDLITNDKKFPESNSSFLNKSALDFFFGLLRSDNKNLISRAKLIYQTLFNEELKIGIEYTEIRRNEKKIWLRNTNKFDYTKYSEGEKIIFSYFLLLLFHDCNSNSKLENSVILIDEPELHLHYEITSKVIDRILKLNTNGQIWIATHNVALVSKFDYRDIYVVEKGAIYSPNRQSSANALNLLLGIDEHLSTLKNFLNSSFWWSYENFIEQCFTNPKVIETSSDKDPQFNIIRNEINKYQELQLLDYGSGQVRIGKLLSSSKNPKLKIDAFEPNFDFRDNLLESGYNEVYITKNGIPKNKYDLIIMCNVLHEINPNQWLGIFKKLAKNLKHNGNLLIIEDLLLPFGEKAHEFNFLVYSHKQFEVLFRTKKLINVISNNIRYANRIQGTLINKETINKITQKSILRSLKSLEQESFNYVQNFEFEDNNKAGREYAFHSQQLVNSLKAQMKYSV